MDIQLHGSGPVYLDIVQSIRDGLRRGAMKPGDRLPTERELAERLNIARGTVNKAYDLLKREGLVVSIQGAGSFIAGAVGSLPESDKHFAVERIDEAIHALLDRGFAVDEIGTLFALRLESARTAGATIRIAAVDCNPEALAIFREQLAFLPDVDISLMLLDDIRGGALPPDIFEPFPLVLTTITHEAELVALFPDLRPKLVRASVSPSQETVVAIASLPPAATLGIITRSLPFRRIILERLAAMGIPTAGVAHALESDAEGVSRVLATCGTVILPPDEMPGSSQESPPAVKAWHLEAKRAFLDRGGRLIPFMYCLERGSLIHMEERIAAMMGRKPA